MRFASVIGLAALAGLVVSSAAAQRAAAAPAAATCRGPFTQVTTPSPGSFDNVLFSAAAAGTHNVWAVGRQSIGSPISGYHNLILFHGKSWTQVTSPNPSATRDMLSGVSAASPSDAWAVGQYYTSSQKKPFAPEALHWDGKNWSSVALPALPGEEDSDNGPAVVDISPADAWMGGGWLDTSTGKSHSYIFHWDGTSWSSVSQPDIPVVTGFAASGPDDVWAIGVGAGPSFPAVIEHYDGSAWTTSDTLPGVHLGGVTVASPAQAWVVGSNSTGPFTAEWNGSAWTSVPAPNPNGSAALTAVSAVPGGGLWAVGSEEDFSTGVGEPQPIAMHWDGTAWTAVPAEGTATSTDGSTGAFFDVVAISPSQVIIVGFGSRQAYSLVARLCSFPVLDAGFGMSSARTTGPGAAAYWVLPATDTSSHELVDGTGFGLFDSGSLAPGSSYAFTFPASGTWTVKDTSDGATEKVGVPMFAISTGTVPTLWWATQPPPSGVIFQVQVMRPGDTKFGFFRNTTVLTSALYKNAPAGTYKFRSRLHNLASGVSTGWSPILTVTVP